MTITTQNIADRYNSLYSVINNSAIRSYNELTREEINLTLLLLIAESESGGGSAGVTEEEVTSAIEAASNLDDLETSLTTIAGRLPSTLGTKTAANSFSITPASDVLFKQNIRAFKASANFNRPANTTPYTTLDAITNSTSSPTVLSVDLASFGATNGGFICITNARVVSSVAPATILLANIFVFNQTFTATNDNNQLTIDDTTAQTGGIVIPCLNIYNLGANSRCVSDPGQWVTQLGASSTTIYIAVQVVNPTYTPANGETFHIILEGFLL